MDELHENPSLDMSSESECAPEPPPRPATNSSVHSIKPPPLPPKKQAGELAVKPPPRPPHTDYDYNYDYDYDYDYDYMDKYKTGHPTTNVVDTFESLEQTPPLPVPARKSQTFGLGQKKQSTTTTTTSEDDYLQPKVIAPPLLPPQQKQKQKQKQKEKQNKNTILLPPPMKRDTSKRNQSQSQSQSETNKNNVTVASYLESKPTTTLDITLSQLTLSGLNELASKLNIPASKLSNMTLVQLTSYLSNYMKTTTTSTKNNDNTNDDEDATFPTFKADFSANFNDTSKTTNKSEPYDRYAVFRELLQQENNKTETETETKTEANKVVIEEEETINKTVEESIKPVFENSSSKTDRYAALRDIVIEDIITEAKENNLLQESNENSKEVDEEEEEEQLEEEKLQNDLNLESLKIKDDTDIIHEVESNIIEYDNTNTNTNTITNTPPVLTKSPVPIAIREIIQTSNHLTSGSVSDVVSGSSPEVDNLATSEVVTKKNVENITRESWAIFDTPQHNNQRQQLQLQQQQQQQQNNSNSNKRELIKTNEKQVQSEEGVSPWSSDSKEFGNGSPSEWQQPRDSGSEGEWNRQRRHERDGTWWDSQGEREGHYEREKPSRIGYTRERRSTDSYDDEWYEPDRPPRRRTRQQSHNWSKTSIGGGGSERVIGDRERERERGQSSSSRDVSPWEEDEPRSRRERDECWRECRRGKGPSWDRDRDRDRHRRRDDSWDEEDDYEYEDEYISGKFHWPERHGSSRDSDRHSGPREPPDHWESGGDQWPEERRHMRRRGHPLPPQEDRWTRPDWDHESDMGIVCGTKDKVRYNSSRWPNQESSKWRDRKRESDRYYKREHSQESPWEDDYSNDPDEPQSPRYLSGRRNWKRPSSASEMDRKTGEIKSRAPYYMGTGGSDGERDRKYRANRRSRSRDSQFSDITTHTRHKVDTSQTLGRYSHRNRDKLYNQKFDGDDIKLEAANINSKKSATLGRKKIKELPSPKIENETTPPTNKVRSKQHLMFENDFVRSETESLPAGGIIKTKFTFENDFENSETESPRYVKTSPRSESYEQKRINEPNTTKTDKLKLKQIKQQKSLFEDDFSPTEKPPINEDNNGITVIAEETVTETRVSFTENNLDKVTATATTTETRRQSKNILSKSRIGNNRGDGTHIKKSESVNIFARENDPFDDDFFSGRNDEIIMQKVENSKLSPNNVAEFKWTEDFDSFDIPEEK